MTSLPTLTRSPSHQGGWGTLRAIEGRGSDSREPRSPGAGTSPEMRTLGVEAPGVPPPILSNSFCSCTAARPWNLDACCASLRLSLLICKVGLQPTLCSEKPPCFADLTKITQRKCLINWNCIVVTHFCPTFLTHEARSRWKLSSLLPVSSFSFFPSSSSPLPLLSSLPPQNSPPPLFPSLSTLLLEQKRHSELRSFFPPWGGVGSQGVFPTPSIMGRGLGTLEGDSSATQREHYSL